MSRHNLATRQKPHSSLPARIQGIELLLSEFGRVKFITAATLCVLMLSVLATLSGPMLVKHFVDKAVVNGTSSYLSSIALTYFTVALFGGVARVVANYLSVKTGWQIADRLRIQLLRRIAVENPVLEIERRPVGDLLEQIEGNADIIGRSISDSGFKLVGNAALIISTTLVLLKTIPAAGVGISILLIVNFFVLSRLSRISVKFWKNARYKQAELFGFMGDLLAARDDLHILNGLVWAVEHTRRIIDKLYQIENRAYTRGRAFWPVTQLFVATSFGLGFAYGLRQLELSSITVGTITAIYLYIDLLQKPLEETSSLAGELQQMMAVLSMTAAALEEQQNQEWSTQPLTAGALPVSFENVTFGYDPASSVLRNVTFDVAPGKKVGIIGRTGVGKSTIINLLCGLVAPNVGRVLIGGVDASLIPPPVFVSRVAVLSQRSHVFSASVRDNISLFSTQISDNQLWEILEKLDAARWIKDLPQGLDTMIGSGGRVLSKGEMQLLMGVRVLLRPSNLLIIDEGTSVMDVQSELSWTKLIETVSKGLTVIMVEHRHTAIREADEVIVIENGRIIEYKTRSRTLNHKEEML